MLEPHRCGYNAVSHFTNFTWICDLGNEMSISFMTALPKYRIYFVHVHKSLLILDLFIQSNVKLGAHKRLMRREL